MYFYKTPNWLKWSFSDVLWSVKTDEKVLYLTFDDGPTPKVTAWVLDILRDYNAKASFFCIGKNVERYPDLFAQLSQEGHSIGNHTYDHPSGWATPTQVYLESVAKAQALIPSKMFRPPYGRISWRQYKALLPQYQMVFWDIVAGDFDARMSQEDCWNHIDKHSQKGSIIVLHDSVKCASKMKYCLTRVLEKFSQLGYRFEAL